MKTIIKRYTDRNCKIYDNKENDGNTYSLTQTFENSRVMELNINDELIGVITFTDNTYKFLTQEQINELQENYEVRITQKQFKQIVNYLFL